METETGPGPALPSMQIEAGPHSAVELTYTLVQCVYHVMWLSSTQSCSAACPVIVSSLVLVSGVITS